MVKGKYRPDARMVVWDKLGNFIPDGSWGAGKSDFRWRLCIWSSARLCGVEFRSAIPPSSKFIWTIWKQNQKFCGLPARPPLMTTGSSDHAFSEIDRYLLALSEGCDRKSVSHLFAKFPMSFYVLSWYFFLKSHLALPRGWHCRELEFVLAKAPGYNGMLEGAGAFCWESFNGSVPSFHDFQLRTPWMKPLQIYFDSQAESAENFQKTVSSRRRRPL